MNPFENLVIIYKKRINLSYLFYAFIFVPNAFFEAFYLLINLV